MDYDTHRLKLIKYCKNVFVAVNSVPGRLGPNQAGKSFEKKFV